MGHTLTSLSPRSAFETGSITRHPVPFTYRASVSVPSAHKGVAPEVSLPELSSFHLDSWLDSRAGHVSECFHRLAAWRAS